GVIGIGSLIALAQEAGEEKVVACIDAHMGEVYHAAYVRRSGAWTEASAPGLYKPESVPVPEGRGWIGCGDGFAAHRERLAARLGDRVSEFRSGASPSARAVLELAIPRFAAGEARDPATAVPRDLPDKGAVTTRERA